MSSQAASSTSPQGQYHHQNGQQRRQSGQANGHENGQQRRGPVSKKAGGSPHDNSNRRPQLSPEVSAVQGKLAGLGVPVQEIQRVLAANDNNVDVTAQVIRDSRENSWSALVKKNIAAAPAPVQQQSKQLPESTQPTSEAREVPVRKQNRKPKTQAERQHQHNNSNSDGSVPASAVDADKLEKDLEAKLNATAQRHAELKGLKDQLSKFQQGTNGEFGKLTEQRKQLSARLSQIEAEASDIRLQLGGIDNRIAEIESNKAKLLQDIADKSRNV